MTALALLGSPAHAQSMCVAYDVVVDEFALDHIVQIALGELIAPNGEVARMEIWAARDGTWVVLGILDDYLACVLLSGTEFSIPESI